jgi:dTDP-4-amino-4,6-dideoxygalactose transaminase
MISNTGGVPFYRHDLGEAELEMVREVLAQPILTTGEYVERVEQKLAEYLGTQHCLCVTSCTGALHMSLLALDIGQGDEVITTPMTFIATATSILETGAKPVFVDVEWASGNLDPAKVEAAITPRTKAIMPVHLFGLMCDMRALRDIADKHGLAIIEDAAHCVEGVRDGARPGSIGDTACFSFYATKNLTCGEGGALVVRDDFLFERLKLLRVHGMTKIAADRAREGYTHWDMVLMGWKYNMSNIEAALLLPQFGRLAGKLANRLELAQCYTSKLAGFPGLRIPTQSTGPDDVHAHHLFPIFVDGGRRDEVVAELQRRQVGVVVNYRAIHLLKYFRENFGFKPGDFPIAEGIGDSALSLPFYPAMTEREIDAVVDQLHTILI